MANSGSTPKKNCWVNGLHKIFASEYNLRNCIVTNKYKDEVNIYTTIYAVCDSTDAYIFGPSYKEGAKVIVVNKTVFFGTETGVPTMTIPDSTSSQELQPNTLYIFDNRSSDLVLTLGDPIDGKASEYHCFIVCTGTPTITWPVGISWVGDVVPGITSEKTYEISILNNIAVYIES